MSNFMHISVKTSIVLGKDEPPPKRPKLNDKKSRSPTRERRKSETEKIVEV